MSKKTVLFLGAICILINNTSCLMIANSTSHKNELLLEQERNKEIIIQRKLDDTTKQVKTLNSTIKEYQDKVKVLEEKNRTLTHMSTLIMSSNSSISSQKAREIACAVYNSSIKYDVPMDEILAVITIESNFNQYKVGAYHDRGLMQIIPSTEKIIAKGMKLTSYNIFNVETNVSMGTYFISTLKHEYGDYCYIVYNQGFTRPLNRQTLQYNLERPNSYITRVLTMSQKYKGGLL